MKLYDSIIEQLNSELAKYDKNCIAYDDKKCWPETKDFELLLQRDTAFELGGRGCQAVNFTCITSNKEIWSKANISQACEKQAINDRDDVEPQKKESEIINSEIIVIGHDLSEIAGDRNYARIALVLTSELNDEELFKEISDIDFVKYHVYPKGYMIRTSSSLSREQVRVGRQALEQGMSFERIGACFISHYLKNSKVLGVKLIFITDDKVNFDSLNHMSGKAIDIKKSVTKIAEGMPTECSACTIKEICNEVEGLRELHFGKKEKKRQKKLLF